MTDEEIAHALDIGDYQSCAYAADQLFSEVKRLRADAIELRTVHELLVHEGFAADLAQVGIYETLRGLSRWSRR